MNRRIPVTALIAMVTVFMISQVSSAYVFNTYTETESPAGYYKTIWGYDEPEMTVGMKLGDKDSDTGKFLTDAAVGTHGYDMVVTDDGNGQNGKYGKITVHGVPNDFSYANPIFDLTRYPGKEKVNDFNGFEEMWIWVDAVGFGDQMTQDPISGEDIEGFDFSFQLYEQDWKDGKKVPGKFERWAVVDGGEYYIQEGSGWKTMTAKASMMTTLPKDYKGWLRLPFDSMEIVAILGIGNMTLDLNYVVNFTLGIPMDESTVGDTMSIDSIVLYSSGEMPEPTSSQEESSQPASSVEEASSQADTSSSEAAESAQSSEEGSSEELSEAESIISEEDSKESEVEESSEASSAVSDVDSNEESSSILIYVIIGAGILAAAVVTYLVYRKRTNSKS